ncbi:hypothetical protein [Verrucosispora sp. NA02020]|uniref:hypothetical protein n=1 Tax=Verrucosispora sp. NA02020 TaxID=2742132 RepID=UPI0015923C60|nr:hypothetical protein [Verrucosispora sp. NA02020]QKW15393.1 hypothetical protein HUT12_23250 [Verrucosispora sp. NA02020]
MTRVVRALNSALADLAVKVIAVAALLLSVYVGVQHVQLTRCLAEYNDANNRVQVARYAAAEQDRAAQDELFRAIAEEPRRGVEALREYNERRAESDRKRRANPLPAPPSQRCG